MKFLRLAWSLAALAVITLRLAAAEAPATPLTDETVAAVRPTNSPPLMATGPDPVATATAAEWVAVAGRDYLTSGLPDAAAPLLREALDRPGLDAATRDALNLDLTSAYLAQGKIPEASAALQAVTAKRSPAYQLRAALLAARSGDWLAAAGLQAQIVPESLSPADRPWYHVVGALLAEQRKDAVEAQAAWGQARDLAVTSLQRNYFVAALWLSRLLQGTATVEQAQAQQQAAERMTSRSLAAQMDLQVAVAYYELNRREEAVAVVNKRLQELPDSDHQNKNTLRLLAAFFAKNGAAPGDPARAQAMLRQVLQDRLEPGATGAENLVQLQEMALSTLRDNLQDARDREALRSFLDVLIRQDHPLLKQMLLLQSQLVLSMNLPSEAEQYARMLLDKFPTVEGRRDPERENARRLLADIAAHQQPPQYRAAAAALIELRNELPPGPERTRLHNLLADLFFLDDDYRRAAESYASLLAEPTPPIKRGLLLRRAVDSELKDHQLAAAITRLDTYGNQPDVDVLDRWYAEWNVLSAMRAEGQDAAAFARLNALLAPAAGQAAPPLALRLRLLWLAARLAVDVHDPSSSERAQTLRQEVDALPKEGTPEITRELRDELAAEALSLSYLAAHDAKKPDEANRFYGQLQENYPGTDAALYATFFKAEALAAEDKTAEAQGLMSKLADQYPTHAYAPMARYAEALYAIPRGSPNNYFEEAIGLFAKFVSAYPNHPLVYHARIEQAKLNRRWLNFGDALRVYQNLLDTYPDHPLRPEAEMGKADCLQGLAALSGDARQRAEALDAFERLVDLPGMPVDKSVEAGVKWGWLLAAGDKQGNNRDFDGAVRAYGIVKSLYLNKDSVAQLEKSPQGLYWMRQCLFSLADILEKQNKPEDAQRIYEEIVKFNIAGSDLVEKARPKPAAVPAVVAPAPAAPSPAAATRGVPASGG